MASEINWRRAISGSARCLCHAIQSNDDQPCPACRHNGSRFLATFIRDNGPALKRVLSRTPREELLAEILNAGETLH